MLRHGGSSAVSCTQCGEVSKHVVDSSSMRTDLVDAFTEAAVISGGRCLLGNNRYHVLIRHNMT